MGGLRERGDCLARNTHSRPAWPPTQVTSSRTRETISVFRSLPGSRGRLFCLTILQPLVPLNNYPCNSVPQCQVMQPQILFLSISQYIHNSSSGRYNGFRETLDRGNSIMCRPELTSTHVSWLVSTEACRSNL